MRRASFRETLGRAIRSTGAAAEQVARAVADAIEGEGPARSSLVDAAREAMRGALEMGRDAGRAARDIVRRSAHWAPLALAPGTANAVTLGRGRSGAGNRANRARMPALLPVRRFLVLEHAHVRAMFGIEQFSVKPNEIRTL